jgi:hypothetical protein
MLLFEIHICEYMDFVLDCQEVKIIESRRVEHVL